jgi:hypothetical protein
MVAETPFVHSCFPEPIGNATTDILRPADIEHAGINNLASDVTVSRLAGCVAVGGTAYYAEIGVLRYDTIDPTTRLVSYNREVVAGVAFDSPYDPKLDDFVQVEGSGPVIRERFTDQCSSDVIQVDDVPADKIQRALEAIAVEYRNRLAKEQELLATGAHQVVNSFESAEFSDRSWTEEPHEGTTHVVSPGRVYPQRGNEKGSIGARFVRTNHRDPKQRTTPHVKLDGTSAGIDIVSLDGIAVNAGDAAAAALVLYRITKATKGQSHKVVSV